MKDVERYLQIIHTPVKVKQGEKVERDRMKISTILLLVISMVMMASVMSGTMHRSDASSVNRLLSSDFSSRAFQVSIQNENGVGTGYYILWENSGTSSGSFDQTIASVLACAIVSKDTSWTSTYIDIGFVESGTAWRISTSDARTMQRNLDSRGGDWATGYILDHLTQIR